MIKKKEESFIEKIEDQVLDGAKNFIDGTIKKKVYRFGEFGLFLVLSLIMFSFGAAFLLGKFVEVLDGGFNFIIVGGLFLIISLYFK